MALEEGELKKLPYTYKPQEISFCEIYADIGVLSKAYHLAYNRDIDYNWGSMSEKKGCHTKANRMMKKEHIIWLNDYLRKKRIAELTEEFKVERVDVIERLMKVAEYCMKPQVKFDRNGKATEETKIDSAGANKALELLGKTIGMFGTDNVDLNQINIEVKLKDE